MLTAVLIGVAALVAVGATAVWMLATVDDPDDRLTPR